MKIVYFDVVIWTRFSNKAEDVKIESTGISGNIETFEVKGKPADVNIFLDANKDRIIKINKVIEDHKVEEIKELIRTKNVIISVYEPQIKSYDEEINKRKSKLTKKQLKMLEDAISEN